MIERRYVAQFSIVFVLVLLQSIVFSSIALLVSGEWPTSSVKTDRAFGNVQIADVPLKGLTYQEAEERLKPVFNRFSSLPITLSLDGNNYLIDQSALKMQVNVSDTLEKAMQKSQEDAGILGFWNKLWGKSSTPEAELVLNYDRGELSKQVISISQKVERKSVPATLRIQGKTATLVPEIAGYRINVEQTVGKIETALRQGEIAAPIPVAFEKEVPQITQDIIKDIDTLISEQSTTINSAVSKRMENVKKVASLINGAILLPHEVFSFQERVGLFTKENGFDPVPILEDEEIPDGLSGAATQVASTLYVSAVKSQLTIVERHNNRRPVEFMPIGQDAYVNDREFDLRLQNQFNTPLYVHAEVVNQTVRIALFGAELPKEEVTLETTNEETFPPDTIVRVNPDLLPGAEQVVRIGKDGLRAKVFTVLKGKDGKEQRKLLSDNYYKPLHNIIASGPGFEGEETQQEAGQVVDEANSSGSEDVFVPDDYSSNERPADIAPLPDNIPPASSGSVNKPGKETDQGKKPGIIYLN